MGNIIKKMRNQAPGGLFWFYIFLPADVAESSMKVGITVKANFIFSLAGM